MYLSNREKKNRTRERIIIERLVITMRNTNKQRNTTAWITGLYDKSA